jgi:endonuclease YncB( thermonuclease family)
MVAFALSVGIGMVVAPPGHGDARGREGSAAIIGQARVVDGDTVDVAGVRVRLEGIDAPEAGQTCGRRWPGSWDCGAAATRHLAGLIDGREVRCESRGADRYGRMLGVCFVGATEINAEMVRQGLAWAFVKYSRTYVEAEAEARMLRLGIWQGEATPAWIYRARAWDAADDAAPGGCAIKGNISRVGQVYHLPWSPWYGKVKVDAQKGERWFCSEEEAQQAGWRPAYVR